MLKEEDIEFTFNIQNLQIGDILLMNTYHEGMRNRMKCVYDHAAIYIGDAHIVEAEGLGVVMSHVFSYGFIEKEHACVLRYKDISIYNQEKIAEQVRYEFGKEYGTRELYKVPYNKDTNTKENSNRTFCSRLVAQAYSKQRLDIVNNPDYCAPDDFLKSDKLFVVEDGLILMDETLKRTVKAQRFGRENHQSTVLQELFDSFSKFFECDIQTMDQLLLAAINNPEKDSKAAEMLRNNKDIYHPQNETKRDWPWLDQDDETFFSHYKSFNDAVWFLICQMAHYDRSYLYYFAYNCKAIYFLSSYHPNSEFIKVVLNGKESVYNEAVRVRKRLAHLYEVARNKVEYRDFLETEHCEYENHEFCEPVVNIDSILKVALQFGFPSNIQALKQ